MNRDEQNRILKQHGYHWRKITQDWLDDNDDFVTEPGWHLYSPDHRDVSVAQAFHEIEVGIPAAKVERAQAQQVERERAERAGLLQTIRTQTADLIRRNGERPADEQPLGERVLDTSNIYGGGDWFVIGDDAIWYVQNNGMDGDDWSHNNIRTGGAGAIGWKISMDTDIEDTLRALVAGQTVDEYRRANNL